MLTFLIVSYISNLKCTWNHRFIALYRKGLFLFWKVYISNTFLHFFCCITWTLLCIDKPQLKRINIDKNMDISFILIIREDFKDTVVNSTYHSTNPGSPLLLHTLSIIRLYSTRDKFCWCALNYFKNNNL